jgi:hypothetical protein
MYWLQTQAPRPDGGLGYPGLRLRDDVVAGAPRRLGPSLYNIGSPGVYGIRRLHAEFTVQEIS